MAKSKYSQSIKAVAISVAASLLMPMAALASNVINAGYLGRVIVTNNGTVAASNVSTVFSLNSTALIAANMLLASANDCAIRTAGGVDAPFTPGYAGNPWVLFVTSVAATSAQNYYLYTHNVTGGKIVYSPGAAGMNVTDNNSLEVGGNFTINQTAFVDTTAGANKLLISKPGAITTNITGNGNITTTVTLPSSPTFNLTPDGAGNVTNLPTLVGAATHWQAVLTNDGFTSYVAQSANSDYLVDVYSAGNLTAYRGLTITNIEIFGVCASNGSSEYAKGVLYVNGSQYLGATPVNIGNLAFTNYSLGNWTSNPATGVAWSASDIDNLQIGIAISYGIPIGEARCTQLYATITFSPTVSVTAQGIATGEHNVTTNYTYSENMSILVDGVLKDTVAINTTASGGNVINNANPWQFFTANVTPYAYNVTISINGTQQARYQWQYGAAFPDLTGNGHTATPSFRTSTSNANVTANLSSFTGIMAASTPNVSANTGAWALWATPPAQLPNMYGTTNATYFGVGIVTSVANGMDMPVLYAGYFYIFGLTFWLTVFVYWLTTFPNRKTKLGQKEGSLLAADITAFGTLLYFSVTGGVSGYILVPFVIIALGLLVKKETYNPWG